MKKTKTATVPAGDNLKVAAPRAELQPGRPDEFKLIPSLELFPDPEQPRKTFTEASLNELAESIKEQGIVQPLIVRLKKAKYRIIEPDLHDKEYRVEELQDGHWYRCYGALDEAEAKRWAGAVNLVDRYVIVAGERRWRASEIAGLTMLPCIVRDLDERRKFAQQIIENNQREGVSAIEEARAMEQEYNRRRTTEPTLKKEDFAKELGMSRADFYGTLVLTRLHPPVETALRAGKISASQAKVIAMVPLPNQQEKVLAYLDEEMENYGPVSVRDLQEHVEAEHVKQLKDAPFKLNEVFEWDDKFPVEVRDLSPINGPVTVLPCEACPYRTGNMLEAFPELKNRPNACTRPDCFALKCKVYWSQKAMHEKQAGKTVLTTTEFRKVKGNYVEADKPNHLFQDHWYESPKQVLGKHAPEPVLVAMPDGLKKFYPKDELAESAKKAKVKMASSGKRELETPEQKTKREAEEKAKQALRDRRQACMGSQIPELMKQLAKLKTAEAWALGVKLVGQHNGYGDDDIEEAAAKSKDPQVRVLGFLFADNDNDPVSYVGDWDKRGVELWKMAGIDLVKGFEAEEKKAQQVLPLPAKADPKQKQLLDVPASKPKKIKSKGMSAAGRARLAAAAKARWAKIKAKAK